MKAFNPDKELKKIQIGNKNKILYGIILILLIISIGSTYALYQVRYSKRIIYTKVAPFSNKDINILAIYLDDKPTDNFPEKGSKVVFDKVVCDNGSTGAFNTNTWELVLKSKGKDKCDVYFRTTTDYIDDSGANSPELYQGLIPVTFDTNGNMKVADLTTNWYDYDDHRWANAVLVDYSNQEIKSTYFNEDGSLKTDIANKDVPMNYVLQMYVWIPRYKYQLFNAVNGESKPEQEIKIEFESGTLSTGEVSCEISNIGVETCENAENGKWFTHPAFTFGNTDLTGIWVGKFEPSGTDTNIKIIPSVTPILNQTAYTMYIASRNIEEQNASNFNLNKTQIDTHMMKNIEWGAITYLSQSKYGRCNGTGKCEEITRNNTQYKTGYDNTNSLWNSSNGVKSSTTGNSYGIYDTNGGAWEYVMGNVVNEYGKFWSSGEDGFTINPLTKYYDKYEYDLSGISHRRGHLGDATRETLKTFGNTEGGWYGGNSNFPPDNTIYVWFIRSGSGRTSDVNRSGIFAFSRDSGTSHEWISFRVVITAQDGNS